jgi:hypothetical protein
MSLLPRSVKIFPSSHSATRRAHFTSPRNLVILPPLFTQLHNH